MDIEITASLKINNVPDYAHGISTWVVRLVAGELWFYGAYENHETAEYVVKEELNNAFLIETE